MKGQFPRRRCLDEGGHLLQQVEEHGVGGSKKRRAAVRKNLSPNILMEGGRGSGHHDMLQWM
jgi:hypothetical protein